MNYVKIIAKSPYLNYSLFVKESDTLKVLKSIRTQHENSPASSGGKYCRYTHEWQDENYLSVSLRKVRINKRCDIKSIVEKSLASLTI